MEPKETKIGQTKIDNQLVADASLALDNENQMHLTVEIKVLFLFLHLTAVDIRYDGFPLNHSFLLFQGA